MTIDSIQKRITTLNHYLFHCASFSEEFFNYITRKCTILDIPNGINELLNLLGEYYLDTNNISIIENKLDFYEKFKDHKMIKYAEALLNSVNNLFQPTISSIDKVIDDVEKNNILYQMIIISSKLENDNLTDNDKQILLDKRKILLNKKNILEKKSKC